MKLNALEDLFVRELSEIYGSERQILKALPKLIKGAVQPMLRDALAQHKSETKDQILRLEKIFKMLGEEPLKLKSYPVTGAIDQAGELLNANGLDSMVRDAALLSTAQKVEHYEIASYGAVHTHAELLGYEEAAELLAASLKEEHEMNSRLTGIAKQHVNLDAAARPIWPSPYRKKNLLERPAVARRKRGPASDWTEYRGGTCAFSRLLRLEKG